MNIHLRRRWSSNLFQLFSFAGSKKDGVMYRTLAKYTTLLHQALWQQRAYASSIMHYIAFCQPWVCWTQIESITAVLWASWDTTALLYSFFSFAAKFLFAHPFSWVGLHSCCPTSHGSKTGLLPPGHPLAKHKTLFSPAVQADINSKDFCRVVPLPTPVFLPSMKLWGASIVFLLQWVQTKRALCLCLVS